MWGCESWCESTVTQKCQQIVADTIICVNEAGNVKGGILVEFSQLDSISINRFLNSLQKQNTCSLLGLFNVSQVDNYVV